MATPDDPGRIQALEADVERLRAERDDLARALAATITRNDRRRGRFEAESERRQARLERNATSIRQRDAALARAQAKLDRPLSRFALAVDRLGRRILGRLRRISARGRSRRDSSIDAAAALAAVRPRDASVGAAGLRIGLVGDPADARALQALLGPPSDRPPIDVSIVSRADAAHDAPVDILIAVSPSVGLADLDEGRVRAAWATSPTAAEADPRFDDFDLVFAPDDVADAIAGRSAQVPVSLATGVGAAATVAGAIQTWRTSPWIAIHIAPKDWDVAPSWGDTLFARGVQRALRRAGWVASIHVASDTDAPRAIAADVALHIAGVSRPPIRDGQPTMLWVISHPDLTTARACEAYDLVFVASDPFAEELGRRVGRPVRVLHQATDPDRFFPELGGPKHDILFVGNSRHVKRPALTTLAGSPYGLAVYGKNWSAELLDPAVVKGEWIPNEDLHCYYRSAAIVLSDHWPDMRDDGFISNRVYDALASGAFVVSDSVAGIGDRFAGAVATYTDEQDLLAVVRDALADPDDRQRRADRGRAIVLARDTFDHRAATIADAARSIGVAAAG